MSKRKWLGTVPGLLAGFMGWLLVSSSAQAAMYATLDNQRLIVWLDDEAEMNWLEIYQADNSLFVAGLGTVNIWVEHWQDLTRFPADQVRQIVVSGSSTHDMIVNNTRLPMLAYGFAGSDILVGGSSSDELHGGDGDDALIGRAGKDLLYGEGDADGIAGGPGADYVDLGGQAYEQFLHGDESGDVFARYLVAYRGRFRRLPVQYNPEAPSAADLTAFLNIGLNVEPIHWGSGSQDFNTDEGDVYVNIELGE